MARIGATEKAVSLILFNRGGKSRDFKLMHYPKPSSLEFRRVDPILPSFSGRFKIWDSGSFPESQFIFMGERHPREE